VGLRQKKTLKRCAGNAIVKNTGAKTYLIIHGFINTVLMDVGKFPLIDLEAGSGRQGASKRKLCSLND